MCHVYFRWNKTKTKVSLVEEKKWKSDQMIEQDYDEKIDASWRIEEICCQNFKMPNNHNKESLK